MGATAKEDTLQIIVDRMHLSVEILQNKVVKMKDEDDARKLLKDEDNYGSDVAMALLDLQEIHGIVLGMHPDSIYSGEDFKEKPNTVFNELIAISKANSELVNTALDTLQHLQSPDVSGVLANAEYCYDLLIRPVADGVPLSFRGIIFRILSNCRQIVAYLENITVLEEEKGKISQGRTAGVESSASFKKTVKRITESPKEESEVSKA